MCYTDFGGSMSDLKLFPIGIQDFAQLRTNGYYYVDKTELVYKLTHTSRFYFMARPRRFGKSLLISTLQCYFEGRKELFDGLWISKHETEWKKYPVIRLDMSLVMYTDHKTLDFTLHKILSSFEEEYGIKPDPENHAWGARLASIIESMHKITGEQVVVLVDEYDTPMLDTFGEEPFDSVRKEIRNLYTPIKALGGMIRFVFLTGISKFSQLSIFSELNNLNTITTDDEYASICGITEEELFSQMKPDIQSLAERNGMSYDEACSALKRKYDGYHFSKHSPDIYNPFSLINALNKKEISNYWFSTGTPTVLTKLIVKYRMDPVSFDEGFIATQEMFDAPTETADDPIPMLYQSGYLTIKKFDGYDYTLGFPNDEVRIGFLKALLPYYATERVSTNDTFISKFNRALRNRNLDEALSLMKAFFSQVPYDAEHKDENHYKTLFFLIFKLCSPYSVRTEERSAAGRADAVVETKDTVYVFEFKMDGSVEEALSQIDSKGYLIPYSATRDGNGTEKKLYKIGANFDSSTRTLGGWKIVEAPCQI